MMELKMFSELWWMFGLMYAMAVVMSNLEWRKRDEGKIEPIENKHREFFKPLI